MGGVDEEDPAFTREGLFQQGLQRTIVELLLGDRVGFGGDASGLAIHQALFFLRTASPG